MVKSKFFSVFFAFALLIPCLFALAACNNNKSLKDNEITITVADKVYDGSAIAVTATATSGEQPTILYKPANAADTEYTSVAPQNAGQYVVSAVLAETETYNAAAATKNFSITPKEVTLNWQNQQQVNGVYDGQAKVPEVTAGNLVGEDVCAVNAQVTNGKSNINAGNFTFTAVSLANANYKLPTDVVSPEYTITQKEVTLSWQEPASTTFVYSGEAKLPQVTANGLVAGDTCAVIAAVTQGQDNINVGNFTCTATGLSNANYKLPENVVSDEYAIAKYVLTGEHVEFEYNGGTLFTADLGSIRQGLTLDITFESKNVGAYPDPTQMVFKLNGDASVNANYEVKISGVDACEAEIVAKEIELNWQDPATTNFVYDGDPKTVTVAIADGQLIGTDTCNVSPYASSGGINAGTFTMSATLDNTNYKVASSSASSPEYTIAPKEIALSWQNEADVNRAYNKTALIPTVTADALSLVGADTCEVNASLTDGNDNVNVGTFTFTATATLNPNYALPQNVVSPEYEITPCILSGLHADDLEYSGSATFEVDLTPIDDGLKIVILFENPNVGNSTINIEEYWFTLNDELTENYDIDNTCSAAIVPRKVVLNWTAPTNLVFNAQAKVPTVTVGNLVGNEICVVSSELTGGENNIGVGTFTFTATGLTGADCANYVLPDPINCVSDSYEITGNSLVFGEQANKSTASGDNWFTMTVGNAGGRFEIQSTFSDYNKHFIYSYDGTDFTEISLGKKYSNPYNYICFDGDADTTYYLKVQATSGGTGSLTFTAHGHNYINEETCYCGLFNGITLTVGQTETGISVANGQTLWFRVMIEDNVSYYITKTNLNAAEMSSYNSEQSSQYEMGFGSGNATVADYDGYYYIIYTATADVSDATITINAV